MLALIADAADAWIRRLGLSVIGDAPLRKIPIVVALAVFGIWVVVIYMAPDWSAAYIKGFGWAGYSEYPFEFSVRMFGNVVLVLLVAAFLVFAVWARLTKTNAGFPGKHNRRLVALGSAHDVTQDHEDRATQKLETIGYARIASVDCHRDFMPLTQGNRALVGKVQASQKHVSQLEERNDTRG